MSDQEHERPLSLFHHSFLCFDKRERDIMWFHYYWRMELNEPYETTFIDHRELINLSTDMEIYLHMLDMYAVLNTTVYLAEWSLCCLMKLMNYIMPDSQCMAKHDLLYKSFFSELQWGTLTYVCQHEQEGQCS